MPDIKDGNNEEEQKHKEEQTDQISDMLADPPEEDEEIEDPQVEEAEGQEEGEEEEPSGEGSDEKGGESSDESDEPKGEEDEEESSPQETIERLRSTIEKMSGGDNIAKQDEGSSESEEGEGEEERPKDPRGEGEGSEPSEEDIQEEIEDIDIEQFVTPEEFEEMQTDPTKFNEVMKRVYKQAENNARQRIMQDVPRLVQKTASRQATYQQAVQNFYDQNPDLKNFKKFVSVTMNEVASENPDMSLETMLQETATRAREQLALANDAREQEEERRKGEEGEDPSGKPAFAGGSKGGRSNRGADDRSNQQKQIDDLIT